MSEYGRLWQKVSDIRAIIAERIPGSDTSTYAAARAAVLAATEPPTDARRASDLLTLIEQWKRLEQQMEACDD